ALSGPSHAKFRKFKQKAHEPDQGEGESKLWDLQARTVRVPRASGRRFPETFFAPCTDDPSLRSFRWATSPLDQFGQPVRSPRNLGGRHPRTVPSGKAPCNLKKPGESLALRAQLQQS